MNWSPALYTRFERERTRPTRDLLAQIETDDVRRAIDLGCGPGNSTEQLRLRFPEAALLALDSSPGMVEAARRRLPGLEARVGDIAGWQSEDGALDVILANASLQWVARHETLLPRLLAQLRPGGSLAVQMPDTLDEPAHRFMREVAAQAPFARDLGDAAQARTVLRPDAWYYALLTRQGATVDLWRTTYVHALPGGPRAIVDWFESTGLRPFLQPLPEQARAEFLRRYEGLLASAYPQQPDGCVLLPFPRLFFIARAG